MKIKNKFQFIFISSLILLVKSLDYNTFSNYKDNSIINLTGLFVHDSNNKKFKGDLNYTFQGHISGEQIIFDINYSNNNSENETDDNNKTDKTDNNKDNLVFIVIISIGLIVVIIISFLIYRSINERKKVDTEDVPESKPEI